MRRAALLALLFTNCCAFAQSAPTMAIANVSHRTTISLDGTWNSIVDPYETGLGSRIFINRRPATKSELVEYDFDRSPKLRVPGDWNTQRDSLLFYEGPVWYQRNFSYHKREHIRTFLYFGAANYQARVWLNGKKLGEHVGGFTPFDFEITDQIVEGDNSVVVEVDNTRHIDGVPALKTDWWNYGGLTRSVELIEVPESFIQNYLLQPAKDRADEISGWVLLDTSGLRQVTVEIPELQVKQSAQTDASGRASFQFSAHSELWTPENPRLYRVVVSAGNDSVTDEIGFRTIEARGTQILLNGKPIFLRGISMHEEAPFRSGRAFSEEDDRTLLTWAKEVGCNYVRFAHYPYNETMLRLADKMGLLVWEEIPVYWDIQWQNPATLENAKSQLREIISRDQNRAAIAIWSMSNETPISSDRTEFLKMLAAYARQLDSTRLIASALNHWDRNGDVRTLSDPFGEALDVLGINEYMGWYESKVEDADSTRWEFAYEKPVVFSEFGAGAQYNLHGGADTRFTEEYQANLYEHQLAMLQKIPQLAGMSPWVLMDFRSPRRLLPGIQDYFNRKGLISDQGQKKQAFYVLQKFYRERAQGGTIPK
ncbi:MAG TPA: glycoside hydrolase family 2 TIM barrel-domain containing protein [Terriglobales bacterium]|nr:glycoside hydrolase family 2 TIM barrel-domain containing protein [Terriglobales bacterium]